MKNMEMSFRWYGDDDPVSLEHIRQIPGMKGIVSAIYDIPVGEVWPLETILALKEKVEAHGLELNVIESVPVHEDIKRGLATRDDYIEKYATTLRHLSRAGVKTVCYNFMPVFDWTRTSLTAALPDGSNSLSYEEETIKMLDPLSGELTLPGWDLSYQTEELNDILADYRTMTEDTLMGNLVYFLEKIIPIAAEEDILMAIHPDDPPWSVFGLPRVVTGEKNILHLLSAIDHPANGLTFCTGSLGANPENDLLSLIDLTGDRIHFVHARNIRWIGEKSFQETSHSVHDGSLPMVSVIKKLASIGYIGPIRPDHGRMIWGETGRAGYGLYDRALGATYINGIIDSTKQEMKGELNEPTV